MTALPPLPASAAPAAPAGGATSAAGASTGGFLELLLAALPGVAPGTPATPGAPTAPLAGLPTEADDADALTEASLDPDADAETETTALPATLLAVPPAPVLAALATLAGPPAAVTEAIRLAEAPATTPTPTNGTAQPDSSGVRTHPLPVAATSPTVPVALTDSAPVALPLPDGTGPATQPASDAATEPTLSEAQVVPGRETVAPAAPGAPVAPTQGASSAAGVDISAMTPVQAATTAAPTAAAPTAPTTPAATHTATPPPVADQVFGEVSRLVTRGDGTHRLTVTLTPEALGDVRVTLTVRNGEVTVDFAAGDEARRALLESAPELRRLLELTGASESRVTVRDGAGSGATAGQAYDGQGPTTSGRGTDDARRDTQDHHAGTREGENAMDGNHRGPGDTRLPHDPVRSTRAAGLDLTL